MKRFDSTRRFGTSASSHLAWFLIQTLGVWCLTATAALTRLIANVLGLLGLFGLVVSGVLAMTVSSSSWPLGPILFLGLAVLLRIIYELCMRGLAILLPKDQSLLL